MRFVFCCLLTSLVSVANAGDFGTLTATYAGRTAGFYQGNGGRFEFTNVTTSGLPADLDLSPSFNGSTLYTFCIELQEFIGSTTFDINSLTNAPNPGAGSFMTSTQASHIEILTDNYYQTAVRAQPTGGPPAGANDAVEAAGFQLAVWEIVFGDYNASTALAGTGISATGQAAALANTLISNVVGGTWTDIATTTALALVRNGRQDQLVQAAVVPEASSILAWASVAGAIGLVAIRRRKLKC